MDKEIKELKEEEHKALKSHYEAMFTNPAWTDFINETIVRVKMLQAQLSNLENTREEDMSLKGQLLNCGYILNFQEQTEEMFAEEEEKSTKGE